MKECSDDEDWTVYWTDYSVSLERVMEMKRFQVSIVLSLWRFVIFLCESL